MYTYKCCNVTGKLVGMYPPMRLLLKSLEDNKQKQNTKRYKENIQLKICQQCEHFVFEMPYIPLIEVNLDKLSPRSPSKFAAFTVL